MPKSFDDLFEEGFYASIDTLLERVKSGQASAGEIKELRALMKDANFFERVILNDTPVIEISERLPFVDPEHKSVTEEDDLDEMVG
jgi:hypothetical protein